MDVVCEYIMKKISVPVRDFVSPPQMIVIRSFDVNKPGCEVLELKGVFVGGSIIQVSMSTSLLAYVNDKRTKAESKK